MRRNLQIFSLAVAVLLPLSLRASGNQPNILNLKESITDESIIYPESFEADAKKMLESWYMKNYTDTDDRYRTSANPATSDDVIRQRLADLPTVIDMPFNQIVRSYIDRYMERGRPLVASLLGLGTYYMPIFEQALEAEQLPLELKYLPVIESALNPNAVSRSGAGGLWQFMPAAAKGYDLEINSLVDERRDPYKSSKMAAKMLRDLYATYGDWSLAIAAYNCGPGAVNKAIRRAGGDPRKQDFWSIYQYLSPETRGYVPMFIAANYVMNYYKEHNISPVLPTRPLVTDTIGISSRVHFDQISKVLDIPKEELRILNPQFRADVIPATVSRQYMLILPAQQVQAYIMSEGDILAYEASKYARRTDAQPGDFPEDARPAMEEEEAELILAVRGGDENDYDDMAALPSAGAPGGATNLEAATRTVTHTVAAGETISDIARRYDVRVSDIRSWNSLRRNAVRAGQKLRIETTVAAAANETLAAAPRQEKSTSSRDSSVSTTKPQKPQSAAAPSKQKQKTQAAKPIDHQIKNGESLSSIAKKYGVTVDQLKAANNLKSDAIRAGKSLTIPAKSGSAASSSKGSSAKSSSKKSSSKKSSAKKSTSKKSGKRR